MRENFVVRRSGHAVGRTLSLKGAFDLIKYEDGIEYRICALDDGIGYNRHETLVAIVCNGGIKESTT